MDAVDVGGLRVAFEDVGTGPPVVLLHGGLADHREWTGQRALADKYRLIAWDAPGCGGSDDPPPSFRMPDYADALAGLIRALGLERPHVVGLSFGATLALALQARAPGSSGSLVLASAYAGWAGSLPPDVVSERLASGLALLERSPAALAESFVATLFSDRTAAAQVEGVRAMLADLRPQGAATMLHSMAECDLRPALASIDVPTLLLHGEHDERAPLPVAESIRAAIPGASLVVLPGVGHQCNAQDADAFTAEVRAFLRACDGG